MVDSRVSTDTHADARLIAFDAEYTGLSYLRYLTVFIIASVSDVNVYAASAIVVISWCINVLFQYTIKKIISARAKFITRSTIPHARYLHNSVVIIFPRLCLLVYLNKKNRITLSEI